MVLKQIFKLFRATDFIILKPMSSYCMRCYLVVVSFTLFALIVGAFYAINTLVSVTKHLIYCLTILDSCRMCVNDCWFWYIEMFLRHVNVYIGTRPEHLNVIHEINYKIM